MRHAEDCGRVDRADAHYWPAGSETSIYRANGFLDSPLELHEAFLSVASFRGHVLDLGCGTGLLLQHLSQAGPPDGFVPFGVDFLAKSVEAAKAETWPEFAGNFVCTSIEEFSFASFWDVVILDPSLVLEGHRERVVSEARRCSKCLLLYSYRDALAEFGVECPCEWLDESSGQIGGRCVPFPGIAFHPLPASA